MPRKWTTADVQNLARKPPSAARSDPDQYQEQGGKGKRATAVKMQRIPGQVLIGIDPGSVVTGFAMVKDGEPPILKGFKSHCEALLHALQLVQTFGQANVHFVIEDARKAAKNGWFAKKNGSRKDQGAGYVKALSKDWECFCRDVAKVGYTLLPPNPAITKWPAEQFEQVTGIKTLKGEHHCRDAYLLIFKPE